MSRLLFLRNLVRTGWLMRGVEPGDAETVTDHSWLVAYTVLVLGEKMGLPEERIYKAVSMALLHDLAEIYIGDLTPPISTEYGWVKDELEKRFAEKTVRSEIVRRLFIESLEGETVEARLVRLSDYLATIMQGGVYRYRGYPVDDIIGRLRESAARLANSLGLGDDVDELIEYVMNSL